VEQVHQLQSDVGTFPDVLGIGSAANLALATFAEVAGAALMAIRPLTRGAAAASGKCASRTSAPRIVR
jgi:hypothetical protein